MLYTCFFNTNPLYLHYTMLRNKRDKILSHHKTRNLHVFTNFYLGKFCKIFSSGVKMFLFRLQEFLEELLTFLNKTSIMRRSKLLIPKLCLLL